MKASHDWILVLADDLTGALEVGAKFANFGHVATVAVRWDDFLLRSRVVVIDTESRHVPSPKAADTVKTVCSQAQQHTPSLIIKKTDSTLRGHIGAELLALQQCFPAQRLMYVPAYPDMGRCVVDGKLLVGGVPVHQTEFAHDPLNPVNTSEIRQLFGNHALEIADGQTNAHIEESARTILSMPRTRLCAGPAALAEALATLLAPHRSNEAKPRSCVRAKVLVVNGSRHPASLAQIAWAQENGYFKADTSWSLFNPLIAESGLARALVLGRAVRERLENGDINSLLVFGGDTAFGIHNALGAGAFECWGEVLPGVPTAICGTLRWITKAGGFGPPDLIKRLESQLCPKNNYLE